MISDSVLNNYQTKLENLRVLLIVSYVGSRFLYCIDHLRQIKGIDKDFGGVTVIFIGDLFQLKAINDGPVFSSNGLDDLPLGLFIRPYGKNTLCMNYKLL